MIAQASTIEQAAPEDMSAIEQLLQSHQLPASDLAENPRIQFFVFRYQGDVVGVVGTELHGKTGLLRSLAVQSTHQGRGFGNRLIHHAEQYTRRKNISSLYLLTTTAAGFFPPGDTGGLRGIRCRMKSGRPRNSRHSVRLLPSA